MRDVKKYRYLLAAVLTIFIFLLGVFSSNFIDTIRTDSLKQSRTENIISLQSQQLQLDYLRTQNTQDCSLLKTGLQNIVKEYNQRLGNLQQFKKKSFFQKKRYETIKHRYLLSGLRYWMFAQDLKQKCKSYNADTILFFTTTLEKENCSQCKKQGRQLTLLKEKLGKQLLVFTIPTQINDGMVEILQERYNITSPPAIVINGDKVFYKYQSRTKISRYLSRNINQSGKK